MSIAKRRWKLLGDTLRKKNFSTCDTSVSVRRFTSFGLLTTSPVLSSVNNEDHHVWFHYTCEDFPEFSPLIRHHDGNFELDELNGFNNTGNVCVWPSEELLSYFCMSNAHRFHGSSVCELGGGMTCLAGLAVAMCTEVTQVVLTDGNEQSVQNVQETVKRNLPSFGNTNVDAMVLCWENRNSFGELDSKFDFIICADCLFFDDCRSHLLNVIDKLLKPMGEAIILAPNRGGTFEAFAGLASRSFTVEKTWNYNDKIWQLHLTNEAKGLEEYDVNLHYPMLMQLTRNPPVNT